MIEIVIAACLVSGYCRETHLTYDAQEVSMMTCMAAGQTEIARWQQEHPAWEVKKWRCGMVTPPTSRDL